MSDQVRCRCQRCTIRSLTWPVIIVTLGLLFLASEMRGNYFDIGSTWPVMLIVLGILSFAGALASTEGHLEPSQSVQPVTPPSPLVPPPPPAPNSYSGQGQ